MIRVFVVTPVRLYREGLEQILAGERDLQIVGTAGDWADAASHVVKKAPDVVLLDTSLPDSVARGEMLCSPRLAATLLRRVATLARGTRRLGPVQLTPRELEIVELIDEGLSNKAIATRLSIELATVKNHVHNILEKLEVSSRAAAAARVRASSGRRRARPEPRGSTVGN